MQCLARMQQASLKLLIMVSKQMQVCSPGHRGCCCLQPVFTSCSFRFIRTATAAGKDLMMAENTINGGLKLVDGPEVRAGRRDLFGVLQGAGNPYAEAHPKGDLWLQSMWTEGVLGSVAQEGALEDGQRAPES